MNVGKEVLAKGGAATDGVPAAKEVAASSSRRPASSPSDNQAIVIDMGKARPKRLKQIGEGKGPLSAQILEAVDQVRATYGADADVELVPVVVIYTHKPKRGRL